MVGEDHGRSAFPTVLCAGFPETPIEAATRDFLPGEPAEFIILIPRSPRVNSEKEKCR